MLFLGTFISSGNATAIVVRIGENTEIGQISEMLKSTTTADIPLRKKMNNFAKFFQIFSRNLRIRDF